jgi:Fic family protein
MGVLQEPTLAISPWFEARRGEYYDRLLAVSTDGDWDGLVRFFARGLHASADSTHRQMLALVDVQRELKDIVRASSLRADTALLLVDFAVANPSFTVKRVAAGLSVSVGRAHALVNQLSELGIVQQFGVGSSGRRYAAPRVIDVLLD